MNARFVTASSTIVPLSVNCVFSSVMAGLPSASEAPVMVTLLVTVTFSPVTSAIISIVSPS